MRIRIALFLSLLAHFTFAQQTLLKLDAGIENKNDLFLSNSFLDPVTGTKFFLLTLSVKDSARFYLLNSNWGVAASYIKKLEKITGPVNNNQQQTINSGDQPDFFSDDGYNSAGTIRSGPNTITNAYTDQEEKIYLNEINFSSQHSTLLKSCTVSQEEKLLYVFPAKDHFFWIAVNKKNQRRLSIYRYNIAGSMDTVAVVVDNFFPEGVAPSLHHWFRKTAFFLPGKLNYFGQASMRSKFIVQEDKLYIVSDENPEFTNISSIDLQSLAVQQSDIEYPSEHGAAASTGYFNHNSFVAGSLLLQANASSEQFYFSICRISDGNKTRKVYKADLSTEINFNNSAIMQYGTASHASEEKELKSPGKFIRKVNGMGLAILASFEEGNIQAEIGSLELSTAFTGRPTNMHMADGGTIQTPKGTKILPGNSTSGGAGFAKVSKKVFFYSIFDANTFEHLPSKQFNEEKVEELGYFLNKNPRHLNNPVVTGNTIVSGYLNPETKQFILVRIGNGN